MNSQASTLFVTNFEPPTYNDGNLINQDGWVLTGSVVTNPIQINAGVVLLNSSGQDARRAFSPIDSESIQAQLDINVSAAQNTGDYFFHLGNDTNTLFYARLYARSNGVGYQLAMTTSSGATSLTYGAVLNFGQSYRLTMCYQLVPGINNDTGFLNVDDVFYIHALTVGTDAASISSVSLRQGLVTGAPTLTVDHIIVKSVPSIPESSSFFMLAIIACSAAFYRKRK